MFDDILSRHTRIALQVSGGKDSLACLYLLKPYWDRLTVYFLNTGDAFPDTLEIMARVREEVPNFIEVAGNTKTVHDVFGIPSDIVPASSTRVARDMGAPSVPLIVDRSVCCALSILSPMMERMRKDGITLIIRGQKNLDRNKAHSRSGDVIDDIEFLYPIQNWNDYQVLRYLKDKGIEVAECYSSMRSMPDCMSCSAWWDEGRSKFLKEFHPASFDLYQSRLATIKQAINRHTPSFRGECADTKE